MTQLTIGIDVSKAQLDLASSCGKEKRRYANTTPGHKKMITWLQQCGAKLVVFEATGTYHRALQKALLRAEIACACVNPLQARQFAQASSARAKTDKVDALMLARMGACLPLPRCEVLSQSVETLKELAAARRALVRDRTAIKNRQHTLKSTLLKRQATQRLKQIDKHIKQLDKQSQTVIESDKKLARRRNILQSMPGLGAVSILTMLADMPELGSTDKRQVASLAGLAPFTRQSGTWQGKSFIQGGRKHVRDALYMPALVAIRFNHRFKARYQHLTALGKPKKVAITAIMRSIIVTANALLRDNRKWTQKTA